MDERHVVTCFLLDRAADGDRLLLVRRSGRVSTYQGRWAGIDQPNWSGVEMSPEGMPVPPYPLPELVVTDDAGAELARIELGTFDAPIATLHDFDGRRLIVSVEALEPASGARTVYLVDLECADCTEVWQTEGPDSFDLVGTLPTEGAVVVTALD